jgi:diacylglycerol kinase family enzyme
VRVVLIDNPRSGRGRAGVLAAQAAALLAADGHETRRAAIDQPHPGDVFVVFGGDGTVHSLLPPAMRCGAAIYHAPLGTENLFAREFAMRSEPRAIADAVRAFRTRPIDAIEVEIAGLRRPAGILVSAGPDAGVIRRLHRSRRGPISHAAYLAPILAEVLRPALPALRIEVDGKVIADGERGMVVVANMRQYAMRFDPVPWADPGDGWLDVVLIPFASGPVGLWRLIRSRVRRHGRYIHRARGREVRLVALDAPLPAQTDGEPLPAGDARECFVRVLPGALRVLLPA